MTFMKRVGKVMDKKVNRVTAGLIVIGDEIIKGLTKEENCFLACQTLFNLGIDLVKVSIIGDDIDHIANEVKQFSSKYSYVLTCGGIGPTHDDLTYEGISKALNDKLELNQHFVNFVQSYKPNLKDLNSPFFKMAKLPTAAKLHFSHEKNKFPLVSVQNIFVFPGIPILFKKDLEIFKEIMNIENGERLSKFYREDIYLKNVDESRVANILTATMEKFAKNGFVKIGSYPVLNDSHYSIKICILSDDEHLKDETVHYLKNHLPNELILSPQEETALNRENSPPLSELPDSGLVFKMAQDQTLSPTLRKEIQESLHTVNDCLARYRYPDEVCIAFNGGKDCSVVLHILYATLIKNNLLAPSFSASPNQPDSPKLNAIYIRQRMPFPEVESFIWDTAQRYNFNLIILEGSYKEALAQLKLHCPRAKAIVMGTRSSDPGTGTLQAFSPTDPGWPEYVRVNPLLGWSYRDIWGFINYTKIPYCSLYDKGYTSIGSMDNTFPNASLRFVNSRGMIDYKSAHLLEESLHERNGRY